MRYSPLNPPPELLTELGAVADAMVALRAHMSALQAVEAALLHTGDLLARRIATVGNAHPSTSTVAMAYRTVQTELGAALHESDRTIGIKMDTATELLDHYPAAHKALSTGRISATHVKRILDAGVIIEDKPARARYEVEALAYAQEESAGRLRPVVKRLAEKYAGNTREEQFAQARAERRVWVIERDDGMADLTAHLPAPYAYGIKERLDQMARASLDDRARAENDAKAVAAAAAMTEILGEGEGAGTPLAEGTDTSQGTDSGPDAPNATQVPLDNRTADQLRADFLTDMLLASDLEQLRTEGATAKNFKVKLQVIVPVRRLTQADRARRDGDMGVLGDTDGTDSTDSSGSARSTGGTRGSGSNSDPRNPGLFDTLFSGAGGKDYIGVDTCSGSGSGSGSHTGAATNIGYIDDVATLEGYGPISDEDLTEIAAHTDCWDIVSVDAETGNVIKVDTYRPTVEQRRFLGARDLHCRFPGCNAAITRCDLDHTLDAAKGGETSTINLGYVCRRHHTIKHSTPWVVTQDSQGVYTWTSPAGNIYIDRPECNVRFRSVDEVQAEIESEGTTPPTGSPTSSSASASASSSPGNGKHAYGPGCEKFPLREPPTNADHSESQRRSDDGHDEQTHDDGFDDDQPF